MTVRHQHGAEAKADVRNGTPKSRERSVGWHALFSEAGIPCGRVTTSKEWMIYGHSLALMDRHTTTTATNTTAALSINYPRTMSASTAAQDNRN